MERIIPISNTILYISSFAKLGIPRLGIFSQIQNFFEIPDPEYESATCPAGYL
jgi:hypothetical protein